MKKIIALLLVILIVSLPLLACKSKDEEEEYSEGLEYHIGVSDCYIVVGIGTCRDKDIKIPPRYKGKHVIGIDQGAFQNCTFIESVTTVFPLDTIGEQAFAGCTSLKKVTLSRHLEMIYKGAFEGCTSLEQVVCEGSEKWGWGEMRYNEQYDCYEWIVTPFEEDTSDPEVVAVLLTSTYVDLAWYKISKH